MKKSYLITGIMCSGCRKHVKDQIEKHPEVAKVEVSPTSMNIFRKPKMTTIYMNGEIAIAELQLFLDKDSEYVGRYIINQPKG